MSQSVGFACAFLPINGGMTMKRRHLITIKAPEDRGYRYRIDFRDTVSGVGVAFFAQSEDEVIEYVMERRKPEPLQLRLW